MHSPRRPARPLTLDRQDGDRRGVKSAHPLHGDVAPSDVPAYTIAEAALILGVPASTLQRWVKGRVVETRTGTRRTAAIIKTPEPQYLSFTNLVEAHIIAGLRQHRIALEKIRTAVRYIERRYGDPHALTRQNFKTDGVNLFLDQIDALVNASSDGQCALREVMESHLRDVEYDRGRAARLYRRHREEAPRIIVIDPRRAFGRPVLKGTSVPISMIAARFAGGDEPEQLARDYEVSTADILEVIRATTQKQAA